jgi:hypothetical protein
MLALGAGMTVFGGLDERERALSILRQSAEHRRFEILLRTRSGELRPFDVTGCVAGNGDGPPAGFILVLGGEGVAPAPGNGSATWRCVAIDLG